MYVGVKTYCSSPGGRMVTSNKDIQSSTTSFEFLDKFSQIKLLSLFNTIFTETEQKVKI